MKENLMTRQPRYGIFFAVLAAGVLAAAPWLLQATGDETQAPAAGKPPHPVVDTHELMELFAEPLYDYLKQEVDKTGDRDKEAWSTLRDRGLQTAEFANLIALREQVDNRDQWIEQCAKVQQAGLKLAEVAKAQKAQEVRSAYLGIIASCNACHKGFDPEHAPQIEP
jgi:hypothetical protein